MTTLDQAHYILGLVADDFARECVRQYGLKRLEELKREAERCAIEDPAPQRGSRRGPN